MFNFDISCIPVFTLFVLPKLFRHVQLQCVLRCFLNEVFLVNEELSYTSPMSYISPMSYMRCLLSVYMACFVTAGAIDLKLCTYVPLGKRNAQTKFWFVLILGLATRDQKRKHINPGFVLYFHGV
jgi:hypothetical protein